MKKAYILHDYVSMFKVSEVEVVAEWTDSISGKVHCVIQNECYIWDSEKGNISDPALNTIPSIVTKKYDPDNLRLYDTLAEIEQVIDSKKIEALAAARRHYRKAESRVIHMENVLENGWPEFPKEEYVSPFSGKVV